MIIFPSRGVFSDLVCCANDKSCLWKYALRAKRMQGYGFRRQRPIGWYIVGFVCLELMLVIEVDAYTHLFEETQLKDQKKEAYLQGLGYTVLRFKDEEVLRHIDQVIGIIEQTMQELEKNCS